MVFHVWEIMKKLKKNIFHISSNLFQLQIRIKYLYWQIMILFVLLITSYLHVSARTNANVETIATIQHKRDKSLPMSSRLSWFFTIIGPKRKPNDIPNWLPKIPKDMAVESSVEGNHCAAKRPGNGKTII